MGGRGGSEQLCHSYFPCAPAASRSSSTNRFFPSLDQPGSSSAWDVFPNCCQAVTGRPCPVWSQQMPAHPLQEEGLGTAQPASSLVILDSVSRNPHSLEGPYPIQHKSYLRLKAPSSMHPLPSTLFHVPSSMSFRTSLSKMFAQLFSNPLTRGISLWEVLPRDRIISCCPLLSCLRPGLEPHLYWSPGVRGQILWFECKITSYHKLLFEHLFWVWKDYGTFRVRDECGW